MTSSLRSSLLLLLLGTPAVLRAQAGPDPVRLADSLSKEINLAWMTGDKPRLEAARRLLDRAVTLFPKDGLLLHYKGYAIYRIISTQPELSGESKSKLSAEGRAALAESAKLLPLPESHVLRRSLLAQSITDAASAMAVTPQMEQELADAMRNGKDNPRVWLVEGIGAFFTPPMYGGGAEVALTDLEKAAPLFKNDHPARGRPDWGEAETYAWIGVAQQKLGHTEAARKAYQEALRLEPRFSWVKDALLPGLEKGIQPFPGER